MAEARGAGMQVEAALEAAAEEVACWAAGASEAAGSVEMLEAAAVPRACQLGSVVARWVVAAQAAVMRAPVPLVAVEMEAAALVAGGRAGAAAEWGHLVVPAVGVAAAPAC